MVDDTIKREVKTEPEDESNDGVCADVFGATVKTEEETYQDEGLLVNPELLAEVSTTLKPLILVVFMRSRAIIESDETASPKEDKKPKTILRIKVCNLDKFESILKRQVLLMLKRQ